MLTPTLPTPPPHRTPFWVNFLLSMVILLFVGGTALVGLWWLSPPPAFVASTSQTTSAPVSSGPAFDPTASAALVVMADAMSTAVAPTVTPLPPTPTYAVTTQVPAVVCGPWARIGEVCEMPRAPAPTATAIPECPVAPRQECVWRGSLTPQPPVSGPGSPT